MCLFSVACTCAVLHRRRDTLERRFQRACFTVVSRNMHTNNKKMTNTTCCSCVVQVSQLFFGGGALRTTAACILCDRRSVGAVTVVSTLSCAGAAVHHRGRILCGATGGGGYALQSPIFTSLVFPRPSRVAPGVCASFTRRQTTVCRSWTTQLAVKTTALPLDHFFCPLRPSHRSTRVGCTCTSARPALRLRRHYH